MARSRAESLVQMLKSGRKPRRYGYGDRPLREEILRQIELHEGGSAVISRNAYGCLVLNTAKVMFVDIDVPVLEATSTFFSRLFNKQSPEAALDKALARVRSWSASHPHTGCRVYRTRAGVRVLITNHYYDPGSSVADQIFADMGADPLYQKLCRNQQSFRARLTPKPWRVDFYPLQEVWPWEDEEAKLRYLAWQEKYTANSKDKATCKLIEVTGNTKPISQIIPLIELHDNLTQAQSDLPLA